MHRTESLNFGGVKNPRPVEQEDRGVDVQDFEGSRPTRKKKKFKNPLVWCSECFRGKKGKRRIKRPGKRDRKKLRKKSIFKKLKSSRCWGRRKEDRDRERKEEKEEGGDEKRDPRPYESRAGTSTRDSVGRLIVDKSDSRISFEERRRLRSDSSRDKKRRTRTDSIWSEKSVSYADTRDVGRRHSEKEYDDTRKEYDRTLRDITKSCCYLCTENSLAIAASMAPQPVLSDKSVEACLPDTLEKSCSPIKLAVHVRTVKSLIRVKIRDTCTSYVDVPQDCKPLKVKKKRRKFRIFPKLKRTECPARRTVGCVTENTRKTMNNCKQREKRTFEPCCKDKAV